MRHHFSFVWSNDEGMQYTFGQCVFVSVNRRLAVPRLTFLVDPEECEGFWPVERTGGSGHVRYGDTILYFDALDIIPSFYYGERCKFWTCICNFIEFRNEDDP